MKDWREREEPSSARQKMRRGGFLKLYNRTSQEPVVLKLLERLFQGSFGAGEILRGTRLLILKYNYIPYAGLETVAGE